MRTTCSTKKWLWEVLKLAFDLWGIVGDIVGPVSAFGAAYLTYAWPKRNESRIQELSCISQTLDMLRDSSSALACFDDPEPYMSLEKLTATIQEVVMDPLQSLCILAARANSTKLYSLLYSASISINRYLIQSERRHETRANGYSEEDNADDCLLTTRVELEDLFDKILKFRDTHSLHRRLIKKRETILVYPNGDTEIVEDRKSYT